jgi:oligopeptide/dipeptide ABC transporter ATP-binding protein
VAVIVEKILEVDDLKTYFYTKAGTVKAVDGISFHVVKGETLGLVGESGSGKTVAALSVLRLITPPGKVTAKKIFYDGMDLLKRTEEGMRRIRGKSISMIFQDPTSSLNPVLTIENQLSEIIQVHEKVTKEEAIERIVKILKMVGIPDAETRIKEYPHQFSGGMKQRVAIARALLCNPKLVFADEPTTALDVTIQAQILRMMKELKDRLKMSMVLITHDMGIVAEVTDRIVVMYCGKICEVAPTKMLFKKPMHPYTNALLKAAPRLDLRMQLEVIPGDIPDPINPPRGCRFHTRCKYTTEVCREKIPVMEEIEKEHLIACHEWNKINVTK